MHDRVKNAETNPGWAAPDVGKRWQLRFFHGVIALAGRRAAYQIMYLVVLWYVIFVPDIRRRTRPYLDRRFPWRRGGTGAFWDSYRLVCSFGHILIDQAAMAAKGPGTLNTVCINEREMKSAVSRGGGAVLLVSHLGCWQIAMPALSFLKKPVSAVMMPQGADSPITGLIDNSFPFSIIDPRKGMEGVVEMMQALGRGELLTIMGDRAFGGGQSTVKTTFLGEEISLPASPYRIAAAAGAPVLILQAARRGHDSYEVELARIIRVKVKNPQEGSGPEVFARRFAETMEKFVARHPWQFFNFFDMWEKSSRLG